MVEADRCRVSEPDGRGGALVHGSLLPCHVDRVPLHPTERYPNVSESHALKIDVPSGSYLLDALETSPHQTIEPPSCGPVETSLDVGVAFRHSGWSQNRARVQRALETLDATEARRVHAQAGIGVPEPKE